MKHLILMSALLLILGACGGKADPGAIAATTAASPATATEPAIAPAIIPPSEVADPAEPPSYEVAIASAAAEHNKALERCGNQPDAVQTQCEQEANAAFSERESALQDLRGNQE